MNNANIIVLCLRRHSSKHSEVLFSYHPCDNVRIIWLWQYPVQFGRKIGVWLFVFGQASTSLDVAREIAVGVIDMLWSRAWACCSRGVRERIRLHGRVAVEKKLRRWSVCMRIWAARTIIITHISFCRTMTNDHDPSFLFLGQGGVGVYLQLQSGVFNCWLVGTFILSMRSKK